MYYGKLSSRWFFSQNFRGAILNFAKCVGIVFWAIENLKRSSLQQAVCVKQHYVVYFVSTDCHFGVHECIVSLDCMWLVILCIVILDCHWKFDLPKFVLCLHRPAIYCASKVWWDRGQTVFIYPTSKIQWDRGQAVFIYPTSKIRWDRGQAVHLYSPCCCQVCQAYIYYL